MKSLVMALKSKNGKAALTGMVIGILVASIGGYFLQDNIILCDVVCISGAIFSMVGAEQFCKLIIQYREELGEE